MATPTPVRVYAGTQEGLFVWRSINGSWENVSIAFKTGTIDAIDGLRSKPNVVYLGVTQDGLYRTDDAGMNWRRVFEGNVRAVTVDPTDEEVIYVGVELSTTATPRARSPCFCSSRRFGSAACLLGTRGDHPQLGSG
jgi:hypothetical protein